MADRKISDIINTEYLGLKKSKQEYIKWVDNILVFAAKEKLTHEEYFRNRELKIIREEAYPITIFLSNMLEVESIEIPKALHLNYDAKLFLTNGTEVFLEVSFAKEGELELLQAKYMDIHGYAPLTGVTSQNLHDAIELGSEFGGDAVESSETIDSGIKLISERIASKSKKDYPPGTILLISFGDDFREENWNSIISSLHLEESVPFNEIYVISTNTKLFKQLK